ncbi:MAG: tRNA ((37)-N6)-threonylcarbamoyltransferase complex dimerization subunit type 1 TsaB [Rhizorhabdus sp.]|nr:tRNA ((37)-N6)-threonylcarbamoyltransferase complex dimerization subunit type 1 TsaB [Rhizorhabdus sp.]
MPTCLVIDTATAACSVAYLDGDHVVAEAHVVVGRGHAERLMPMIAALPGGGRADAILVDCGPGSFTGVRVGIAAARALGLGWSVPVRGYSSMALIAGTIARPDSGSIAVALTGGHGELFVQRFSIAPLAPLTALESLRPEAAAAIISEHDIHGSGAAALVAARGFGTAYGTLPIALHAPLLPDELRVLPPQPIYGRDADATVAAR